MKFEVYRDKLREYRWRLVASNGKTVADSGEGYKNRKDVIDEIQRIKSLAIDAPIVRIPA